MQDVGRVGEVDCFFTIWWWNGTLYHCRSRSRGFASLFTKARDCLVGYPGQEPWNQTVRPEPAEFKLFSPTWARSRNVGFFVLFLLPQCWHLMLKPNYTRRHDRLYSLHPDGDLGMIGAEVRGREHKHTCPGSIISHGGWIKDLGWIATIAPLKPPTRTHMEWREKPSP